MSDRFANLEIDGGGIATAPPPPNPDIFKGNGMGGSWLGTAREVNGVHHNALGLESTADHKHVSVIWQNNGCEPFGKLVERVTEEREGKRDEMKSESWVRLDHGLHLPDGRKLTPYALEQLATRYTDVPMETISHQLKHGYVEHTAQYVNDGLNRREIEMAQPTPTGRQRKNVDRDFLVRARQVKGEEQVRAILSEKYGVIDNHHAVEMLLASYGDMDMWEKCFFSHGWSDADNIHGNILVTDHMKVFPDSDYGVGISFTNSEVGRYAFKIAPFLFRAICLNGCIWGRKNSEITVNKRHMGKIDMLELQSKVILAVHTALSEGNDVLRLMGYTRNIVVEEAKWVDGLTNTDRLIAHLSRKNNLSVSQGKKWNEFRVKEYNEPTAFNIINALTRAAQEFGGQDRVAMEEAAGNILAPKLELDQDGLAKYWDRHRAQAKDNTTERQVRQYVYAMA